MKLLSMGAVLSSLVLSVSAFANQIFLMGESELSYAENDNVVLNLPACAPTSYNHMVSHIQLKATQGNADIERLAVTFFNGENEVLSVRENIDINTTTRWIDLSGEVRCIKQIRIIGDTDDISRRRAVVQIFGQVINAAPVSQMQPRMFACKGITNNGCFKTVSCPVGQRLVSVRAACDLETAPNYEANGRAYYDYLRVNTLPFGVMKVIRQSDIVSDGICQVGDTRINRGSANLQIRGFQTSIDIGCREHDGRGGGDCVIAGDLVCASSGPMVIGSSQMMVIGQ